MLKLTLAFFVVSVCVFAGPCGWDWCYSPQEYCSNPPQCAPPDQSGMLTEISDCGYYPFGSMVVGQCRMDIGCTADCASGCPPAGCPPIAPARTGTALPWVFDSFKVIMNMWARYSSSWTYSHGACIRVRQERVHGPTLVTAIPLRIVL